MLLNVIGKLAGPRSLEIKVVNITDLVIELWSLVIRLTTWRVTILILKKCYMRLTILKCSAKQPYRLIQACSAMSHFSKYENFWKSVGRDAFFEVIYNKVSIYEWRYFIRMVFLSRKLRQQWENIIFWRAKKYVWLNLQGNLSGWDWLWGTITRQRSIEIDIACDCGVHDQILYANNQCN